MVDLDGQNVAASDQAVAAGVSAAAGTAAAVTTDWTFGGLWPFEPRWYETSDGRLHYIDEGPPDGRPVVLVHGNPTWGFLYRNFMSWAVAHPERVSGSSAASCSAAASCTVND